MYSGERCNPAGGDSDILAVMAFARTGDPQNPSIVHWPCSIPGEEYTLLVGKESRVAKNFDHQLIAALRNTGNRRRKKILLTWLKIFSIDANNRKISEKSQETSEKNW